jgi:hypothetical protein
MSLKKMSEIQVPVEEQRFSTNISGLDACLAESEDGPQGLQYGTSVLLSGMPGGGKSSIATIMSSAPTGRDALYLSGEERAERVKARWTRLGLKDADPYICPLRAVEDACEVVRDLSKEKPLGVVVVDSVQTMTLGGKRRPEHQLEAAEMLCGQICSNGGAVILVSHVSKTGQDHAGAAALAHVVDIHLHVTANAKKSERLLEVRKNRMGRAGFQVPLNITLSGLSVGVPAALSPHGGTAMARTALEKACETAYVLLLDGKRLDGYDFDLANCGGGMWRAGLEMATKRLVRDGFTVLCEKVNGRKGYRVSDPPAKNADGSLITTSEKVVIGLGNDLVTGPEVVTTGQKIIANGDKNLAVALAVTPDFPIEMT